MVNKGSIKVPGVNSLIYLKEEIVGVLMDSDAATRSNAKFIAKGIADELLLFATDEETIRIDTYMARVLAEAEVEAKKVGAVAIEPQAAFDINNFIGEQLLKAETLVLFRKSLDALQKKTKNKAVDSVLKSLNDLLQKRVDEIQKDETKLFVQSIQTIDSLDTFKNFVLKQQKIHPTGFTNKVTPMLAEWIKLLLSLLNKDSEQWGSFNTLRPEILIKVRTKLFGILKERKKELELLFFIRNGVAEIKKNSQKSIRG